MDNTNQPLIARRILKNISIIHFALCLSVFVFGTFIYFTTENTNLNIADTEDVYFFSIPVFAIVAALVGNYLFRSNLKRAQEKSTLKEKLMHYQSSKIIQFALVEAPAFLCIVIFMTTSNQFYLFIAAILLAYLIFLRPTTSAIKEDLDFNAEQAREFRDITK